MRQIGRLPVEADARRFVAYLATQNIGALAESEAEQWSIWVRDEDQRQQARQELELFVADPQAPRYRDAERTAESIRREQLRQREKMQRSVVRMGDRWRSPVRMAGRQAPVIVALVFLSVLVTLGSWFGRTPERSLGGAVVRELAFAERTAGPPAGGLAAFDSIRRGEVWRLITPVFLHFGWEHIIFNMVMFFYLGSQVERLRGPVRLAALLAILAIVSNVAQAYLAGPNFGGMSGVVYGLLGFIWMKSRAEPESGFYLDPLMFAISIAWFFLCLFEVVGDNVANYAHAGGLVAGVLIGLLPARRPA